MKFKSDGEIFEEAGRKSNPELYEQVDSFVTNLCSGPPITTPWTEAEIVRLEAALIEVFKEELK